MDNIANSVIILAAGKGSRFKSVTPKIFHKIGGLSMLDHIIRSSKSINPSEIVVVLNPEYEKFEFKYKNDIKKAYQSIPKGTGDAVNSALGMLNDNGWVYILYADIPLVSSETLIALSETAKKCEKTAVVVLAMNAGNSVNLGKLEPAESEGTIKKILEAKDSRSFHSESFSESSCANAVQQSSLYQLPSALPLCNTGLFVRKKVLKELMNKIIPSPITGEIYITDIVKLAYEAGYVCRYYEGDVIELSGANSRLEFSILEGYFQKKMREKHLNNGVTMIAPETVYFSYDTEIESDAIIHPHVVFLEDVQIKSGASIGPFCVVEGAKIHSADVGPFARIRPGSEIKDGARIGNFVEIKNSEISEKVKINHLSYVGDSFIGKQTNIGAGTITCNYDGFEKHKTYIGENVLIGSNSAIVAPVKINNNAIIGAGSVITKEVNDGDLSLSRTRQQNITNWATTFRMNKMANQRKKGEK